MAKKQWDAIRVLALLVNEVDLEILVVIHGDSRREVGELVELGLGLAPIESISPVSHEAPDVVQGNAIVPPCAVKLVGEAEELQFLAQELEIGLGYGDAGRLFCGHDGAGGGRGCA